MRIKEEKKESYKFYTPKDTGEILFNIIKKEGMYQFNFKKKKEERKDWWYRKRISFSINPNLIFGKIFPVSEEDDNKEKYLNFVIEEVKNNQNIMSAFLKRIEYTIDHLKKSGFNIEDEELLLDWRMVVGLGAFHPQETSMIFHHIYGIPYIPGSALKGITRHWFLLKKFEVLGLKNFEQINYLEKIFETADIDEKDKNEGDDEKLTEENFKVEDIAPDTKLYNFLKTKKEEIKIYQLIFGTQKKRGKVIFFDAYPVGSINLKIDIMNPHYPEYYSDLTGRIPPTDWQSPKPIKFLTVERTKFKFWLGSQNSDLLRKAKILLVEALSQFGVGAKTSLGYGVFVKE